MDERWHRHLGVYGICVQEGKILVVNKKGGPYTNRYDLPGGTVEPHEPLVHALHRELKEETGLDVEVARNLGVRDYVVPYKMEDKGTTHVHHVALYYEVGCVSGELTFCTDMDNNDSIGPEWVDISRLHADNSSPLVMEALAWVKDDNRNSLEARRLDGWKVI